MIGLRSRRLDHGSCTPSMYAPLPWYQHKASSHLHVSRIISIARTKRRGWCCETHENAPAKSEQLERDRKIVNPNGRLFQEYARTGKKVSRPSLERPGTSSPVSPTRSLDRSPPMHPSPRSRTRTQLLRRGYRSTRISVAASCSRRAPTPPRPSMALVEARPVISIVASCLPSLMGDTCPLG
jgi:hypothetical protein